jgi:hypothetical protein
LKDNALKFKGNPDSLTPLPHAFPSVTLSLNGIVKVLEKFKVIKLSNSQHFNNFIIDNNMIID